MNRVISIILMVLGTILIIFGVVTAFIFYDYNIGVIKVNLPSAVIMSLIFALWGIILTVLGIYMKKKIKEINSDE